MSRKRSRVVGVLPLLLVMGILLAGCGETTWSEFSSAEGAFSVLMPGTPTEQTQTQDTELGTIDVHSFTFEQNGVAYLVGYNIFPAAVTEAATPDSMLDGARGGQVEAVKGTLMNEEEITLGAYLGRDLEIQIENSDGTSSLRSRIFLVGDRLYQVMVVGPKGQSTSPDTTKFLDSFKLVEE
jgi:hypothetical protein